MRKITVSRKGLILTGGSGGRLHHATLAISKATAACVRQAHDLLPVKLIYAEKHARRANHQHHAKDTPFCPVVGRRESVGVVDFAKSIQPSPRGGLEITAVNEANLNQGRLSVQIMQRGYAWLDTGSHDSLLEASQFIATLHKRLGLQAVCLEEIAWRNGWIDSEAVLQLAQPLLKNGYGQYLQQLVKGSGGTP